MIIACDKAGVGSGFMFLPHSTIFSLTNLTINEGAGIKASDDKGGTIHLVNRPNIKGTWGFFPIADGIYHYKGKYNLGVANGGTGLITVPEGNILFGEDAQLLGNSPNFTYASSTNTLSVGDGGIIVPANTIGSPAANQLWVNSADSNKLYFGSSEVGSGGGGGGGTVDVVSNVATNTILGRNDAGSGDSEELTPAEVRTMLDFSAQAISAVEGESTLDLTGALTVQTDLKMTTSSDNAIIENITQDKDIIFKVNDGGSSTEVMRIDGDVSRVGIGTNSPQNTLHVKTTQTLTDAAYAARFQTAEGNVAITRYGGIHIDNDNNAPLDGAAWSTQRWQISQRDTDHFDIAYGTPTNTNVSASDTDLRITNTGNVGIGLGNTNPSQKLHVNGTIRQTGSTSSVLVSDSNGDITSASNLQDLAYLGSGQAQTDTFTATTSASFWATLPLQFKRLLID